MAKVNIDQNLCIGCGVCTNICGSAFEMGPTGTAQLCREHQEDNPTSGTVPNEINCEAPAECCPVNAIKVK